MKLTSNSPTLHKLQIAATSCFDFAVLVLLLLSIQWIVYLYKDSKHAYYSWKYRMSQNTFDDWNEARNFKHRLNKNMLLIAFLCFDIISCFSLLPQFPLRLFSIGLPHSIGNCTFENMSWLHEYYNGGSSLWTLEATRMSSFVMEQGIFDLILLYLIEVYTKKSFNPVNYRPIFIRLLVSLLIFFLIFILNLIPSTFLLGQALYAVALLIYAVFIIKHSRKLSMVLGWRYQDAGYIYSENNAILLNESRVIRRYRKTILPLYLSMLIASLGQVLYIVVSVILDTVLRNPCWFYEVYGVTYTEASSLMPSDEYIIFWDIGCLVVDGSWLASGMVFFVTVILLNIFHFVGELYQEYRRRRLLRDRNLTRRLLS